MPFIADDEGISENKKQSLNLSTYAKETIQGDMATFGVANNSTFVNRIFSHFFPYADASITLRMDEYRDEFTRLTDTGIFKDSSSAKEIASIIRNRLLHQKEEELTKKANSYEKGERILISLNKENWEYLSGRSSSCREERYYKGKRGRYLKSLIEEYTRLPYVDRELIYFNPIIEIIKESLSADKPYVLKIELKKGNVYYVYPYKLLQDSLSTANYLTGYSRLPDAPKSEKKESSFRISNICSIKPIRSQKASLSRDERKNLDEKILSRGVQFLVGGDEDITVRLTSRGRERYNRMRYLRPAIADHDGDIYSFRCTAAQAEYYFSRLGPDAEIISPISLRDKMRVMFQEAARVYNTTGTD